MTLMRATYLPSASDFENPWLLEFTARASCDIEASVTLPRASHITSLQKGKSSNFFSFYFIITKSVNRMKANKMKNQTTRP